MTTIKDFIDSAEKVLNSYYEGFEVPRERVVGHLSDALVYIQQLQTEADAARNERDALQARVLNEERVQGQMAAQALDLAAEVERLKQSMVDHFKNEHLAGDGPEIDRWKAEVAKLRDAQRHVVDRVVALVVERNLLLRDQARILRKALENLLKVVDGESPCDDPLCSFCKAVVEGKKAVESP